MPRTKINSLLILQALTILFVIIGHAPLDDISVEMPFYAFTLYQISHLFCMPTFFIISGYLFFMTRKDWKYRDMIRDKIIRLGIPFVFFNLVAFAMKLIFPQHMVHGVDGSIPGLFKCFAYPGKGALSQMWFISVLFTFFVFRPFWKISVKNTLCKAITGIILIVLHFLNYDCPFLCLGESTQYAIFFYLGIILSESGFSKIKKMKTYYLLTASSISVVGAGFIFDIVSHTTSILYFIIQIGTIILFFLICNLLDKYWPQALKSFREYSYQIYLMGIFPQILIKILYHSNFCNSYLFMYSICILSGIYVPVIITMIVKRMNVKIFKILIGLN